MEANILRVNMMSSMRAVMDRVRDRILIQGLE